MRTFLKLAALGLLLSISGLPSSAFAQTYSIDWYKIAGGGGTSTGGTYQVSGTIGQPDASGAMTGGSYSLTGGFWALISVVQTPGAPTLYISHNGNNVTIYWQVTSGWGLQQNTTLSAPVSWITNTSWAPNNGTNYVTIPNPSGKVFYRLEHQ